MIKQRFFLKASRKNGFVATVSARTLMMGLTSGRPSAHSGTKPQAARTMASGWSLRIVNWAWEGAALYVGTASSVARCAWKRSSRASGLVAIVNRPHIGTPMIRWMFYSAQTCTILGSIPAFATFYNVGSSHLFVLRSEEH